MNEIAEKIFKMKYAKDGESWEKACLRVALAVADAEETPELKDKWTARFQQVMAHRMFIPGGRVLSNAGTNIKNLNNCFVLPVEDTRDSIYGTLRDAAEIFAWGGGVGYNFSNVREKGSPVRTTGGKASGPLSFMSLFDQTGEVISQASRRGAQMGMLDIDHPDIEEFISFKSSLNSRNKRLLSEYLINLEKNKLDKKGEKYFKVLTKTLEDDQLTHFNISVVLTDEFMMAVINDDDWDLISRLDGSVVKTVRARDLLRLIAETSWKSGDPGVFFSDRANEDNMVKYLGELKATNPCVTGDTLIHTVYYGPRSFEELAEHGEDVLVYSWDPETHLPVVRTMRNPRKTRENAECVEITFDSGLKVKCTLDHNFYTFRGQKVEAKDLKVGQSIRAFSISIHRDGHLRAHGWGKNGKAHHQYVARMVWESAYGKITDPRLVLHHKDFQELNNQLDNLQLISPELHNSIHYQSRVDNGFHPRNHKVVNISPIFYSDVYNGTVDETHTYIIADPEPIAGVGSGIVSCNCGEVPLLPYEPCCLGSINLHAMYDPGTKRVDFELLEQVVRTGVRFLDDVQTVSYTPIAEVNKWSKGLRRLGLGVMGWADLLAEMEIPYDSKEALDLAETIAEFISFFGWVESLELAQEKGPFPMFRAEEADFNVISRSFPEFKSMESFEKFGVRNVAVTSIAPTGTIALIAEVNGSIEPFFALAYKRNITTGIGNTALDSVIEVNPILFKKLLERGVCEEDMREIREYILKHGTVAGCPKFPESLVAAFRVASEINWQDHVKMQSAWQKYTDNSISKTINMPEKSSVEDIEQAIIEMWNKNLKGGTIYRDNSKSFQILEKGSESLPSPE